MRKICISDITLRKMVEEGKTPVSFNEKTEIVKSLDKLNVGVIETAPIINGKKDVLFLHTVSMLVKNSVLACPTALNEKSVEETYDAVKNAANPRLIIPVPVSTVQMEYICKMKSAKVLELIKSLTEKACGLCGDVEVEFIDATRAETEFLYSAIKVAIDAGAKTITVCDDAGDMLPNEYYDFISGIKNSVDFTNDVKLYAVCNDKLCMASACVASATLAGADGIKATVNGDGVPSIGAVSKLLRERGVSLDAESDINVTKLEHVIDKLRFLKDSKNSATPFDSGTGKESYSDISFGSDTTIADVAKAVEKIGYELSDDDVKNVYDELMKTASKKTVGTKELDFIIASTAMQVPPTYKIKSFVINSGDIITPTANIELYKNGELLRGFCIGDGPIDAAFLAIERITGHHYELDDFQIKSVTRGFEAMGSAVVKLRHNGKIFSGSGISTDIVASSIYAYISALNKITYEEGIS